MKYSFGLIISLMIFGGSSGIGIAQEISSEDAVQAVLQQFFDAMREGDGKKLSAIILPDAPLETRTGR